MKYILDKRLARQNIDGTLYVVSPWDHKLHKLNETASFVLDCVEKGYARTEITARITREYEVREEQARKDVDSLLSALLQKGIINPHDTNLAGS